MSFVICDLFHCVNSFFTHRTHCTRTPNHPKIRQSFWQPSKFHNTYTYMYKWKHCYLKTFSINTIIYQVDNQKKVVFIFILTGELRGTKIWNRWEVVAFTLILVQVHEDHLLYTCTCIQWTSKPNPSHKMLKGSWCKSRGWEGTCYCLPLSAVIRRDIWLLLLGIIWTRILVFSCTLLFKTLQVLFLILILCVYLCKKTSSREDLK